MYDGESSVLAAETLIRSSSGDQAIEFFGAVQERRTSEVIVAKRGKFCLEAIRIQNAIMCFRRSNS